MKIYKERVVILDVTPEDSSYYYSELRGEEYYLVEFTLTEYKDIPFGSYITNENVVNYFLHESPNVTQVNGSAYRYKVRFEGYYHMLKKCVMRNNVDKRISFILTATPREHLQMILEPLQLRYDTLSTYPNWWKINDSSIDSEDAITISYDELNCWEALQLLASELDVDFEFKHEGAKTITHADKKEVCYVYSVLLKKLEHNYSSPLVLEYGKGKGFKGNVERIADENSAPIGIARIKASNVNAFSETSDQLLLPKRDGAFDDIPSEFDGQYFDGGFDSGNYDEDKGRKFTIGEDLLSVRFNDSSNTTEGVIDCTDIYPTVTLEVFNCTDGGNIVKIESVDSRSFEQISGKELKIIFQTGMLAGKEFACKYNQTNDVYEIEKVYVDGYLMPDDNYMPIKGDKFILHNIIFLPGAIKPEDNYYKVTIWGKARIELLRKALKGLIEREKPQYSYRGEIDDLWLKNLTKTEQEKLKCGGCVKYKAFGDEPLLRIEAIKRGVNNPYKVELTFSNKASVKPRYSVRLLESASLAQLADNRDNNFRTQTINSINSLKNTPKE